MISAIESCITAMNVSVSRSNGQFSPAKRKYGKGLIVTKLDKSITHSIAIYVVVLN